MSQEHMERRTRSVREAADIVGISESKFWELVWSRKVRAIYVGRRCLIPIDAIEELLKTGTRED